MSAYEISECIVGSVLCIRDSDRLAQEPAERVLVTHGTPLLSGGVEALRTLAARVNGRRPA
jgi:hypothetical protein